MKIAIALAAAFVGSIATMPVYAKEVFLVCDGTITIPPHDGTKIGPKGAILDIEEGWFSAPLISGRYKISNVTPTEISFGAESDTTVTYGVLDRVSGAFSLNQMTPADRQKARAGQTAKFKLYMSGTCAVTPRMF